MHKFFLKYTFKLLFHKTLSYLTYKLLYGKLRTSLQNMDTKMDMVFLMLLPDEKHSLFIEEFSTIFGFLLILLLTC